MQQAFDKVTGSESGQYREPGSLIWLWLSLLVLLLDQGTKHLASMQLDYGMPLRVLPFFDLTLLHNRGAAFSFLAQAGGWQRWFFAGTALLISLVLVIWLKRTARSLLCQALALSLILGGALGNLYDRVLLGHVVDFISLHYGGHYYPAFNLADSAITLGAGFLIWDMWLRKH
jgi:signal peptidase II